jgi:predicted nucleic acid-binding protein
MEESGKALKAFVLDSSAVMACLSPDELPPAGLRSLLETAQIVVPSLFPFEVANVLFTAHQHRRLDAEELGIAASFLSMLDLVVEPAPMDLATGPVTSLAAGLDLTVYDAAYLELAQRRRLPLATLDEALRKAAKKAGVRLL